MLEGNLVRVIPTVAFPMIISMLIDSLYNIADAYFVSRLGLSATAAVGVNDALMQILRAISLGFGMGAASYISRLMGAKRETEASKVGTTTLFTALGAMAVIALTAHMFIEPLVMLMGSTETSKQYSIDYARFILYAAPFTAGEVVLSQILRSEGSTKFSMFGMVSGCGVNIALDPLFIYGLRLGVSGAAIATGTSKAVGFVILLIPFLRGKTVVEIKPACFAPSRVIYTEVAKMGIPTFLRSGTLSVANIVTNNVAGSFGDVALAAVSVGNKCTRMVGAGVIGFGQGFQPVAGYCWGAQRYRRVHEAFWVCSAMGAAMAVLLGTLMGIFAPNIIEQFADDSAQDAITIGSLLVRTQCVTMVFHIWVMILNGLFRALGRPVPATILGLSRQVICFLPCLLVLSRLYYGVNGLASAQAAADIASMFIAVPLAVRILREIREKAETPE